MVLKITRESAFVPHTQIHLLTVAHVKRNQTAADSRASTKAQVGLIWALHHMESDRTPVTQHMSKWKPFTNNPCDSNRTREANTPEIL